MSYMFNKGFLPFDAPLFMDEVMIVVALLPLLLVFAIGQAKKNITLHKNLQIVIYMVGMIFIGYFEYGARAMGGFSEVFAKSPINHTFLYGFLFFHIVVAVSSIFLWSYAIFFGLKYNKKLSKKEFRHRHIKLVRPTFLTITLTSVTGVLLYVFMYVIR